MNATRRPTPRKTTLRNTPTVVRIDDRSLVRLSRVRTALERIQSGYYDRDEVRDRLASAVLAELQKR
jgi:hypothetical protein